MNKVRFVEPQGRPERPLNVFIRWPLIGPVLLATILDKRGYDARVYNENFSGRLEDNLDGWKDLSSSDVVVITVMSSTANRGYAIADRLRREAPGVRIAFGGVHATFCPEEALAHGDLVACGEGENVIEKIASGEVRSGIVRTEPVADLDTLPAPNFNLLRDFDKLVASYYKRELYEIPMMTSRGCPWACNFCAVSRMFGRKVRRRSVEKVLEDFRYYESQGFRMFYFYDDNFLSDREWAMDLLNRMRPMKLRFQAEARIDFSWTDASRTKRDVDLLRALHQAGCMGLIMGYECIDEETSKEYHKGYALTRPGELEDRFMEDTAVLHTWGIWSYGMFVFGPTNDQETLDRILRFAKRSKLHSLQVSILTPFPGTPLFDEMKPHLILNDFPADWDYYDGAHCVWGNGKLRPAEVQHAILDIHKRFYRGGGWTWQSLRTVAGRPIPLRDKFMDYYTRVIKNRDVFGRWAEETKGYIAMLEKRGAQ